MSIIDPLSCGYVKVIVFNLLMSKASLQQRIDEYNSIFSCQKENFAVSNDIHRRNFPKIKAKLCYLSKRHSAKKKIIMDTFSLNAWIKLSLTEKCRHRFSNCQECVKLNANVLSLIPTNTKFYKKKASYLLSNEIATGNKENLISCASTLLDEANRKFKKQYFMPITNAIPLIPDSNLIQKPSRTDTKKLRNKYARLFKCSVEKCFEETAAVRAFGTEISLRKATKIRMNQSFETFANLKVRNEKKNPNKLKDHTGNYTNKWNENDCWKEVVSYVPGTKINFTELAQKYNVINSNGEIAKNRGQIVKQFLSSKGVDLSCLKYKGQGNRIIRRCKKKIHATDISIPAEPTIKKIKLNIKEKVSKGEYTIGELIIPQKFQILTITDDKSFKTTEVDVAGRKIPLNHIRKTLAEKHKCFMRLHSESEINSMSDGKVKEELNRLNENDNSIHKLQDLRKKLLYFNRRRHIQVWHDGSTVNNHSHLLFMVNCVYDKAIYYTEKEYFEIHGKKIDVQAQIEKPELYIFARCSSTDKQLMYTSTRNEDNRLLGESIDINGEKINDIMRFFHGDAPACQFEIGQQKGGDYPCCACPININRSYDTAYSFYQPLLSIENRVKKLTLTQISRNKINKQQTKLYKNLPKHEIIDELNERGIYFQYKSHKKILQQKLDNEMHGMQRLPALLFNEDFDDLEKLYLSKYEILPCEPLHDVKGHTSNLYEEISSHLNTIERKLFKEMVSLSFDNKDCKRGIDYRKSLSKLVLTLKGKIDSRAYNVLLTMFYIQGILYGNELSRTIENILFLYNQTFLHSIYLKELIKDKLIAVSQRKMYG
ncbi:uncharacterized protein LOC136093585 [Hydra vulgaris]|uniref:uncharacterized protein LOC136093585 n=1 Tax=Hydra vulgaris TaxID=6087 RepID=UPI0032EA40AA